MPLTNCPVCSRQVSTAAVTCPQCGHPLRAAAPPPPPPTTGPTCYSCSAAATTRCQRCGVMSCPLHLQNIYVEHGQGGGYELRCEECYSSAMAWKTFGCVLAVIVGIIMVAVFLNMRAGPFGR